MIVIGRNPVREILASGKDVSKVYIRFGAQAESFGEIHRLAGARKIPVVTLPKMKFDRLGNMQHAQGIAALVEEIEAFELEDLLALTHEQDAPFFVALDGITDPHNLGAIIRSAECAGVHGMVLPKHDSAMISDTVMKTSSGAASHLPLARVVNLQQAFDAMKEQGIWIAGLDADGDTDLLSFDGALPVCVVVGSERGMRPIVRKQCDMVVRIPMWGKVDSLNASVAAALMLYEVRRKRL
jgi:23S rRNA (guanosine2251-2'-O)-methyltransferase